MAEKKDPETKKEYDPEVYKRLKLVEKQFQRNAAEQKKQAALERRQAVIQKVAKNKISIGRWVVYGLLGGLVLAVIGVLIWAALSR